MLPKTKDFSVKCTHYPGSIVRFFPSPDRFLPTLFPDTGCIEIEHLRLSPHPNPLVFKPAVFWHVLGIACY